MVPRFDGRTSVRASICAVLLAALPLAAGGLAAQHVVKGAIAEADAGPGDATLDLIDEAEFKTFLIDSIAWHRRLQGASAWVLAPEDARYFDEARALGTRVLKLGFDSAEAQANPLGEGARRGRKEPDADAAETTCTRPAPEEAQLKEAEDRAARVLDEYKVRLERVAADARGKVRKVAAATTASQAERDAKRIEERIKVLTAFEAGMQSGRTSRERARKRIVALETELAREKGAPDPEKKIQIAFLDSFVCLAVRFQLAERRGANPLREVIVQQRIAVPELRDTDAARDTALRADKPDKEKPTATGSRFGTPADANRTLDHLTVQRYRLGHQSEAIGGLIADAKAQQGKVVELRAKLRRQIERIRDAFLDGTVAAGSAAAMKQQFDELVRVNLPLARQERTLTRLTTELNAWRGDVDERAAEAGSRLKWGGTLVAIELISALMVSWVARLAIRRVGNIKQRRFLDAVRRGLVVLVVLVVVLNAFVSDLSTFATVAGLGAAGVAFALQSLILSAVAYFFLIGRYGAHSGDRVTIAGVTGEIVEVGLFRLSLVELAGQAGDLHPTGRIVVFPNSVIFQASANFYKQQVQQSNGGYAWRELALSLAPDCDVELAEKTLLAAAQAELAQYDERLHELRREAEQEIDAAVEEPKPSHRLRFAQGGLEFVLRYPVVLSESSRIDDELTRALVKAVKATPGLRLLGDSGRALIVKQPAPAT